MYRALNAAALISGLIRPFARRSHISGPLPADMRAGLAGAIMRGRRYESEFSS